MPTPPLHISGAVSSLLVDTCALFQVLYGRKRRNVRQAAALLAASLGPATAQGAANAHQPPPALPPPGGRGSIERHLSIGGAQDLV